MRPLKIHYFETLPSTQTWAKDHLEIFDPKGLTAVIAESQTSGRGRQGRSFDSPIGGLYLTLVFQMDKPLTELVSFGLVVGIAVARLSQRIRLKWPNDIMLEGKKAGGILVESRKPWWMVGVGLNITSDPQVANQPVTSFKKEGIEIEDLESRLIEEIASCIDPFLAGGFAPFHTEFEKKNAYTKDDPIMVRIGREKKKALYRGISVKGELLALQNGQELKLSQSEIL